ncbi:asparaginase [Sporobolomyces koalae]|uniref:asparaginase n=1 Tax=Sporobolomyces koalae TaxID=500713 RepID=UPI0031821A4E
MLPFVLSTLALAGSALAAPLVAPSTLPTLVSRDTTPFNVTYRSPRGNSTYDNLPKLLIVATGGTIAGQSASETDSTAYTPGVVKIDTLIDAVPELLKTAQIDGIQYSNVGSESLTDEIALGLSKLSNQALCGQDAQYDAVLITHGSDTLEETAFLLDVTVNCSKPVVVVGSMRPSTAISADGPNNLLSAARTAVAPASRDRGALIVLNDRICSAHYCQKNEQNTVDTFTSPEFGFLGHLLSIEPVYHYPAVQPLAKKTFDVSSVDKLPQVEIFYGYQGSDWHLVNASIASGAKGLIIAGTGAGSMTDAGKPYLDAVLAQGIPVVRSSKINNGFVVPQGNSTELIASGSLNPVKARRMLQVLLALNKSNKEIRSAFEEPLDTYLHQF